MDDKQREVFRLAIRETLDKFSALPKKRRDELMAKAERRAGDSLLRLKANVRDGLKAGGMAAEIAKALGGLTIEAPNRGETLSAAMVLALMVVMKDEGLLKRQAKPVREKLAPIAGDSITEEVRTRDPRAPLVLDEKTKDYLERTHPITRAMRELRKPTIKNTLPTEFERMSEAAELHADRVIRGVEDEILKASGVDMGQRPSGPPRYAPCVTCGRAAILTEDFKAEALTYGYKLCECERPNPCAHPVHENAYLTVPCPECKSRGHA